MPPNKNVLVGDALFRPCSACKALLPLECFSVATKYSKKLNKHYTHYNYRCKSCTRAAQRELYSKNPHTRANFSGDIASLRAHDRAYYQKTRDKRLAEKKAAAKTEKGSASLRRRRLKKYGLTAEDFDRIFNAQNRACDICKTATMIGKGWCVDHDHNTGEVRAILCSNCNAALGFVSENPDIARAVLEFILKWKKR